MDLSENAVDVAGVSKRFRFRATPKRSTLKDLVLRRVRHEGSYAIVDALDDVSFSVGRGETLGVIGENGSGKTTLLRVLAGITKPDRGEVRVRGGLAPLLALGTGFNPYLTGRENALVELLTLGFSRTRAKTELDDAIEFSELGEFIDAPMHTYSSGMAMRLAFAAATRLDPDILLIDEALAVGDERFAAKCTNWLDDFKNRGKTTILVSHSSDAISSRCDRALWLNNGRVAAFGEPSAVIRAYTLLTRGAPVAEMLPRNNSEQATTDLIETYRARIARLLPILRVPLVGYVRQSGTVKGFYEDGWTDGALEFVVEALRGVSSWTISATVPEGTQPGNIVSVEVDGTIAGTVKAVPGAVSIRCEAPVPAGGFARVRVVSATVNHRDLGISEDQRNIGARIDEITFEHSDGAAA